MTDMDAYLKSLDAWCDGTEVGQPPREILMERGFEVVASSSLSDPKLNGKLWELVNALAGIGLYVTSTDHLSDRQLYEYLEREVVDKPALLFPDDPGAAEVCDVIGGFSEEDLEIYWTYYADEESRTITARDLDEDLPPSKPRPFDRDRFLPNFEKRAAEYLRDRKRSSVKV